MRRVPTKPTRIALPVSQPEPRELEPHQLQRVRGGLQFPQYDGPPVVVDLTGRKPAIGSV